MTGGRTPGASSRRWARDASLVGFLLVGGAACPRPTDGTPQIEVSPGAAGRIGLIPSRAGKAPAAPGGRARVRPLARGEALGGPNATGRPGDWVLENDEVVFVIDALGREAGFAESGGNLIDAADARTRRDELGQLFTYFGAFPRQAVYTSIDARALPDGSALVEARGRELYEPSLAVTTRYRLAGGDRALLLETTLVNEGTAGVTGLGLGDAIQWGGAEKVAPGKAPGFRGPSRGPFIAGIGRFVSYAITSTEGEIAALSGRAWTDTEQAKDVTLAPGERVTYARVFVVGERADLASVVSELTKATPDGEVGEIEVSLVGPSGAPVRAPAGAKIVLGTERAPDVLSLVAAEEGASFRGEVPVGAWLASYAPSVGRRGDGKRVPVVVRAGEASRVTLAVSEPLALPLGPCEEPAAPGAARGRPVPCKLSIEGLEGAADPDLGPAHVAGLARNVVTLRPGEIRDVPLPHGRYRVTGSRGPAYDLAVAEVTVPGGPLAPFVLRRVVDTSGYVGADFHQHTVLSADAPVATRDRVLANAAEGLEVAVSTEHNWVADLAPVAEELGLGAYLVQLPGVELTSDASRQPFGHANVFPMPSAPDAPRGGAPRVRDRLASDVFAEVRALTGGPRVVQINHPRAGANGYFDRLGFEPATGAGTAPGYDAAFDALEVWNGGDVARRARVLEDLFALLRAGRPVTPIANTDTHGVVGEEPGYPRTFVRLAQPAGGAALEAWDPARTADLVRGVRERRDVVLTNGPFLRVAVNGAPIGGVAAPRGGVVEVDVTVVTAPWIAASRAEVRFARGAPVAPVALNPTRGPDGALVARARWSLRPTEDDALVVIVSGEAPMRPVLGARDDAAPAPWAMSGPIWLDADGDGRSLGRER